MPSSPVDVLTHHREHATFTDLIICTARPDSGVPIEDISRLVSHRNTVVTETVYRKQIRPVLIQGAKAMDDIFGS
ncbi:hypothetical protein ACSDR0_17740 [Streptosporangium sp. G11]|uniref:hypothetical protein n=1 Tax=Streptosporangium sp. G11 TaxID=3436926 RepID=UPI003EB6E4B8